MRAEVVAPDAFVAIDRGCEAVFDVDAFVACEEDDDGDPEVDIAPFEDWMAECARKAARKLAKNGRWVDMVKDISSPADRNGCYLLERWSWRTDIRRCKSFRETP